MADDRYDVVVVGARCAGAPTAMLPARKGYEVLLLNDPVDEVWVGSVTEFEGKPLQSVAKGEVDLDSEDDKAAQQAERDNISVAVVDLRSRRVRGFIPTA